MTPPLIRRLTLQNFLSYGPEGMTVDLLPLNVLIGPNASGKSNLLEALAILRATTKDLQAAVRGGGGVDEYIWKGDEHGRAEVNVTVPFLGDGLLQILYSLRVEARKGRLEVTSEVLRLRTGLARELLDDVLYAFHDEAAFIYTRTEAGDLFPLEIGDLKHGQSILSQRRDPDGLPELTYLADRFEGIALFQEWNFGRRTAARAPQPTDLPTDFLLPDASNLGLVLHDLWQTTAKREELIGYLRRFYESARYISTRIYGGTLQLFIEEEDGRQIPATRLSDGTLRYLCLLAILCHPSPPPVIGIEEPELGLHPDILPTIAELLKKASERTQLFVTTHSEALVSALSDTPESILVCESMPGGTTMERLDGERLRSWLDEYSLGEIWRMGVIGGNRW